MAILIEQITKAAKIKMKCKKLVLRALFILQTLLVIICTTVGAQTPFTAGLAYLGVAGSGDYTCWDENDNVIQLNEVTQPLIFVEGIDPNTVFAPNGSIDAIDMHTAISSTYSVSTITTSLREQIQALGYDLIVLNFNNGGDYIQRNAYVLEELIEIIHRELGEEAQPVVVGYSMGGVVARYALAHMESRGLRHWCPLFVSFDAPQQGANVPLGLQALTQISSIASIAQADLALAVANLNCQAARQLVRYRLTSALQPDGFALQKSQEYVDFFDEMSKLNNCLGFPTQSRNIAISLGSGEGVPQNYNIDLAAPNGTPDQQHAGFEIANINGRTTNGAMPVWDGNCDGRILPLVVSFGTRYQDADNLTYPNSNDRNNYAAFLSNADRDPDIDIKYKFPFLGQFSLLKRNWRTNTADAWSYDIVPGSVMPLYANFLDGIAALDDPITIPPEEWDILDILPEPLPSVTLQVSCANRIGDDVTFIPTVSALCYDYTTPFENINANADRLDFTPFDNIIYADANRQHNPIAFADPVVQHNINSWLVDELSQWKGFSCRWGTRTLSGTLAGGASVVENQAQKIIVQNYDAQINAQGHLTAATEIELLPNTDIKQTSDFILDIEACESKACHFTLRNQTSLFRQAAPNNTAAATIAQNETNLIQPQIYPNPTTGLINVKVASASQLQIFDLTGTVVVTQNLLAGKTSIIELPKSSTIFIAKITNQQGYVFTQKIIRNN
jgi:pimeloyl-ACP methyl ester carboxylesterase